MTAIAYPSKWDHNRRQVAAVTYKLKGETIKYALFTNPGKVIVCPCQVGKTSSLIQFCEEIFPDGVILFFCSEDQARTWVKKMDKEFFNRSTIVWGNAYPNLAGLNQPIFADEIAWIGGTKQREIVQHPDFLGAVTTISDFMEPEVRDRCIPY